MFGDCARSDTASTLRFPPHQQHSRLKSKLGTFTPQCGQATYFALPLHLRSPSVYCYKFACMGALVSEF
jgi:hypothetical protein